MKPLIFYVEAAGEFRPVELTFATEAEVRRVRTWRKAARSSDAAEFAALAAKRWFYYTREGAAATSLPGLRAAIRRNDRAELAFLLAASAPWAGPHKFLAVALCRRTWCHHLAVDFLAVHPRAAFLGQPIRGLGTGMLSTLVSLATALDMDALWGEATASSAPFYEKILRIKPIKDLFVVHRSQMEDILRHHMRKQQSSLAKLTMDGQSG